MRAVLNRVINGCVEAVAHVDDDLDDEADHLLLHEVLHEARAVGRWDGDLSDVLVDLLWFALDRIRVDDVAGARDAIGDVIAVASAGRAADRRPASHVTS